MANQKRSAEDQAAINAFTAEREAKDEAERLANRSIEEIYLDAFTAYTSGEAKPPHILEALATVAAYFHDDDPEFVVIGDDGKPASDPNNAQFNQKGIMGNFCNQARFMLEREERRMRYLLGAAGRARANHKNGEIDDLELEEAELNYGRSKVVNLPILQDFAKAANVAYLVQYGEKWQPYKKADTQRTTDSLDERFSHRKTASRL